MNERVRESGYDITFLSLSLTLVGGVAGAETDGVRVWLVSRVFVLSHYN